MLLFGKVIQTNHADHSGIVRDLQGNNYFFSSAECENETLPEVGTKISFFRDEDFKFTRVACLIKLVQSKRAA